MQEPLKYPPVPMDDAAASTNLHFPEHERLTCPRCESTNTKFCYFNNYNLSQPRHYCKSCKRYWTKGGSLRNIPIGGTIRKTNKKSKPGSTAPELDRLMPDRTPAEEHGAETDLVSEHVESRVSTTRFL